VLLQLLRQQHRQVVLLRQLLLRQLRLLPVVYRPRLPPRLPLQQVPHLEQLQLLRQQPHRPFLLDHRQVKWLQQRQQQRLQLVVLLIVQPLPQQPQRLHQLVRLQVLAPQLLQCRQPRQPPQ
jgi:hypothetical protein